MFRASVLSAILVLISLAPAASQTVSGERQIADLTITYSVSDSIAQANVSMSLGGAEVDQAVLTYAEPIHNFSVKANGSQASGQVRLSITQKPFVSQLAANVDVRDNSNTKTSFQGGIASWTAPDSLILLQTVFNLTSELHTTTIVRNGARYGAEVEIFAGDILLTDQYLLPPSNVSITLDDLIAGSVKLNKGAELDLTPPSALSKGMVSLKCVFSASSIPPTVYKGAIALWPLANATAPELAPKTGGDQRDAGVPTNLHVQSLSNRPGNRRGVVRVHARPKRLRPQPLDNVG